MKKLILPTGDFDVVILETGSRLMVSKPKHLMQEVKFLHGANGIENNIGEFKCMEVKKYKKER